MASHKIHPGAADKGELLPRMWGILHQKNITRFSPEKIRIIRHKRREMISNLPTKHGMIKPG